MKFLSNSKDQTTHITVNALFAMMGVTLLLYSSYARAQFGSEPRQTTFGRIYIRTRIDKGLNPTPSHSSTNPSPYQSSSWLLLIKTKC